MIKTIFICAVRFYFLSNEWFTDMSNISIYGNGNAVVASFNPVTLWAAFDLKELLHKKESPKGFERIIKPILSDKIKSITILTDDTVVKNKNDKKYCGVV